MYDVKSKKAEEFISDEEILVTLEQRQSGIGGQYFGKGQPHEGNYTPGSSSAVGV